MTDFKTPTKIEDVDVAFPATVSHLMPDQKDIPDEFKNMNNRNAFLEIQSDWFFKGLDLRAQPSFLIYIYIRK